MAKKRRSAAQKRATRKLVARNKAKSRRSTPKRRKTRKTNKRSTTRRTVAKKKKSSPSRRKFSVIDRIPILKNKTVQRVGFGLGMGSLAGLAASFIPVPIIQQNRELINTGVAFAAEPLAGVVRLALSGGLGQLTGLLGGNGGNSGNGVQNAGFA